MRTFRKFWIFLLLLTPTLVCSSLGFAQSKKELKQIEKKLEIEREALRETLLKKSSVLDVLEDLQKKLASLDSGLKKIRNDLSALNQEISAIQAQVSLKEKSLEKTREQSQKRLVTLYKMGEMGGLKVLFSAHSFTDLVRRSYQLNYVLKDDIKVIRDFDGQLKELFQVQEKLESERRKRAEKEKELRGSEEDLQQHLKQKREIFATIANEEDVHRRYISELEEARGRLESLLNRLAKDEQVPSPAPAAGFAKARGRLPAPVKGRIVKKFGKYQDPKFFTYQFHKGIDIGCKSRSEVRAVFAGKVVFSGWFKGFGQMVIIDHGDGFHTLLAQNSEVLKGVGEMVAAGEVVGRLPASETDAKSAESMLYFEIRQRGQSVDPLDFLSKDSLR